MHTLMDIETPALIVDRRRVQKSIDRMAAKAQAHGVIMRPHMKTAKCAKIAELALASGAKGVTVACLKEAEHFLEAGIKDILYAACITPNKFNRVASLIKKGAALSLLLDHPDTVQALADYAAKASIVVPIWLEIDSGEKRTGVDATGDALLALAEMVLAAPALTLKGVLAHAGHAYGAKTIEAIKQIADDERSLAVKAAQRLQAHFGLAEALEVSIGSTPTAVHGSDFEGVSELRPGCYVMGDLFQWQLGSHHRDDMAVSVLAQVMSVHEDRVIIDAGGLALSKDRSTQKSPQDFGYGLLADARGIPFEPMVQVNGVHQEHGEIFATNQALPWDQLKVGDLVRVYPNHACMMAAPYDRYYVVDGNDVALVDEWQKTTGWS